MTHVYVLDTIGYDQRGGWARVFSTLEKAQAAAGGDMVNSLSWLQRSGTTWDEDTHGDTMCDSAVIYLMEVDSVRYGWDTEQVTH